MLTQQCSFAQWWDPRDEYTDRKYYKTDLGLTAVPTNIPEEALKVILYGNKITRIEANVFSKLSQCTFINLRRNSIREVEAGAFNGLSNLTELVLSVNPLTTLRPDMFKGLDALTTLRLFDCNINIEVNTFSNLRELQVLVLSYNNISHIDVNTFSNLTELQRLDL